MSARTETWCDRDEHNLFERYADFNEWQAKANHMLEMA